LHPGLTSGKKGTRPITKGGRKRGDPRNPPPRTRKTKLPHNQEDPNSDAWVAKQTRPGTTKTRTHTRAKRKHGCNNPDGKLRGHESVMGEKPRREGQGKTWGEKTTVCRSKNPMKIDGKHEPPSSKKGVSTSAKP